jgi:hypothetical protein
MAVEIPNATDVPWIELPAPIRHFIYTVRPLVSGQNPNQTIRFFFDAYEVLTGIVPQKASTDDDVAAYIKEYAKISRSSVGMFENDPKGLIRYEPVSPLDLKVGQCWAVFELDPRINWRYSQSKDAFMAKKRDDGDPGERQGYNAWLRHVNGAWKPKKNPVDDFNSRFSFFAVMLRTSKNNAKGNYGRHFFDVNVEFFQNGQNGEETLELTIDPDVGNEGPDQFPP